MMLTVSQITGLEGVPSTQRGVRDWLKRNNVATIEEGNRFTFSLFDLPQPVQRAYLEREAERQGVTPGDYDDAAHDRLAKAAPGMRAEAFRMAEIAAFVARQCQGKSFKHKLAAVQKTFGQAGNSESTLRRILKDVKGVAPINYAPALLPDYGKGGAARCEISDAAWSFFMTIIRDAAEDFPLIQAWRDVRDVTERFGWTWASYPTVRRRWDALPEAQKLHARHGHEATVKLLGIPAQRDKTSILPLEWVSLDGRTKDFWAHNGDGKARRYTFLALVDCATGFVLDWTLAESENARATVGLIQRVCEKYGIFDRLYPDNGSAFAGHLVAGGAVHKFRNKKAKTEGVKPLGTCHHLGIAIHFAWPGNGQSKAAERSFGTLSRVIDDRPELKGAHAGHKPGAAPSANVVPVDLAAAKALLTREVARHNAEPGRRGQGMEGRSYQQAFVDGLAHRVRRQPTARQLYLSGLIYTPVAVDRFGQVRIANWTYGGPDTQAQLRPYHKKGDILLGRDPDNFEAPAMAWNEQDELICEGIAAIKRGAYGSVDGVREATRNRAAARKATRAAAEANEYMAAAEFRAALAALPTPAGPNLPKEAVVAGHFAGTLQLQKKTEKQSKSAVIPTVDREELAKATGLDWSKYGGTKAVGQV